MPKLTIIAIVLLLTFFVACKKDKSTNKECTLSEASLIGTYTFGSITYKASPSAPPMDASSILDPCEKDDEITLGANGVFTYTDAGTKCNPPGDGTSTWSLQGNVFTADVDSGTIQQFSCTGFTIASADYNNTGDTLLISFKRK